MIRTDLPDTVEMQKINERINEEWERDRDESRRRVQIRKADENGSIARLATFYKFGESEAVGGAQRRR